METKQLVGDRDVISVFKSFLDDGQYVYDFVDLYYIRSLKWGIHMMHDILIYGYGDGLRVFHVYAYHGEKLANGTSHMQNMRMPTVPATKRLSSILQYCIEKNRRNSIRIRRIGNHILDYRTKSEEAKLAISSR